MIINDIDSLIQTAEKIRKNLNKSKTKQVSSSDEITMLKALCHTWFKFNNSIKVSGKAMEFSQKIEIIFKEILECTDRKTLRSKYRNLLRDVRSGLIMLRSELVSSHGASSHNPNPPDFSRLISSKEMQVILSRRWNETIKCMEVGACLAATVLMGSILEALLLARVNAMPDKSPLFSSKSAPMDSKTKKPRQLKEWTLGNFLDVAYDLKWIQRSARDAGVILRDYRNFIHPEKELTHGISMNADDVSMFWAIIVPLSDQIIGK